MGDSFFLVERRLVEAMHLVGTAPHEGESARLTTLRCRGLEQGQEFESQEGVGLVVDLHNSLMARLAELIVHEVDSTIQEQDVERIQLFLDLAGKIDDAGLVVEVDAHDSDFDTRVGGCDGWVVGEVLGGFFPF